MIHDRANPNAPATASHLLWLVVIVVGAAFYMTEHLWTKSLLESYAFETKTLEDAVNSGSRTRQVGFLSLAGLGVFLLMHPRGQRISLADPLAWALIAFCAWSLASVAWSVALGITVRRVFVLLCCVVAAAGVARHFGPRRLATATLLVAGTLTCIGVAAELSLGTFRPWVPGYRFGGTLHPNTQACYCALAMLAAWALADRPEHRRWLLGAAVVFAVLLLLTKSRTCGAAALFAVGVAWAVSNWNLGKLAGLTLLAAAGSACLLLINLAGGDVVDELLSIVLMGRQEQAASLSGRLPLWGELLHYSSARPLLGYGYDTFWNDQRIADISDRLEWAIPSGHSSYIDVLLGTGLVGLALAVFAVAGGLLHAVRRFRATGRPTDGFTFTMLVFAALCGLAESTFAQPMLVTFIAGCGLVRLALVPSESIGSHGCRAPWLLDDFRTTQPQDRPSRAAKPFPLPAEASTT